MINFRSDNEAPVAPEIMAALADANPRQRGELPMKSHISYSLLICT